MTGRGKKAAPIWAPRLGEARRRRTLSGRRRSPASAVRRRISARTSGSATARDAPAPSDARRSSSRRGTRSASSPPRPPPAPRRRAGSRAGRRCPGSARLSISGTRRHGQRRQGRAIRALEGDRAVVHLAHVALAHETVTVCPSCRIASVPRSRADDARQAHLARDDRRVTGPPAAVGHHGRGLAAARAPSPGRSSRR
jgi:hypothetical protein